MTQRRPLHRSRRGEARARAAAPRKRAQRKAPAAPMTMAPPQENPAAKALAHKIAGLVLDKKGLEVLILDVRGKTSYADYFVIASGESARQVTAMAEHVDETLREDAIRPLGVEGYETGHWVLLDYGEVVAHLFDTEVRAFYDLEGLWTDVPHERVA